MSREFCVRHMIDNLHAYNVAVYTAQLEMRAIATLIDETLDASEAFHQFSDMLAEARKLRRAHAAVIDEMGF